MNGAEALMRTLLAHGTDVCFMNPGTSEMQFVAHLDAVPEMRGVLALFEGVATGAADGWARMTGRPGAALLHLGPGLGNGLANLHNARRARTPVVAVVGDHATFHKPFDAQLESDIESAASNPSQWVGRATTAADVGSRTAEAAAAALGPPSGVATLIVPADAAWDDGARPAAPPSATTELDEVAEDTIAALATLLSGDEPAALFVGGSACRAGTLRLASAIANRTGARLLCETFPARLERGAGVPAVERLAYLGEFALAQLEGVRHLLLVDAAAPVAFFAYPGRPSSLVPEGCATHVLAGPGDDAAGALAALAERVGATPADATPAALQRPAPADPEKPLTADAVATVVGCLLPEGAIVSDESNTSGIFLPGATAGGPPHDWLTLTGGAIGQGLPLALGAAIACPDRKVIALEADGSALYTQQAWWTMAREGADVITIVLDNRSYAILHLELGRVGAGAGGPAARSMLDLSPPDLDFVALANGMGVPATRATTAGELAVQLKRALAEGGPAVIDATVAPIA